MATHQDVQEHLLNQAQSLIAEVTRFQTEASQIRRLIEDYDNWTKTARRRVMTEIKSAHEDCSSSDCPVADWKDIIVSDAAEDEND